MLIGSQQTPSEATGWRAALPTATLLVSSWSWPKDGLGPRPVAQTAKRYFLNQLETSSKPWLYLRSCTANCQLACVVWQLAFVRRGSGQGTPSQGSNTMACVVCPKFSLRPFLHLVASKASSDALPLLAAGVGGLYICIYLLFICHDTHPPIIQGSWCFLEFPINYKCSRFFW